MKKIPIILWLIGAFALASCQENIPQPNPNNPQPNPNNPQPNPSNPQPNPAVLGSLELTISNGITRRATFTPNTLGTRAILNKNQLTFTSTGMATILTETNGLRNFDYVSEHFTITNNTGNDINNLTLVALAQTGNLGGTAIKSATAFNGSTLVAATAQAAHPTHTMKAGSGAAVVVDDATDISRASFQALTTAEATAIQNDAQFASQGLTGTVLEYGFVATNNAANSRTIPSDTTNPTGKVSLAMRFPKPATATGTYSFTMTFAVTAEATNRVTKSPEEPLSSAQARAGTLSATQTVQIDNPTVVPSTSVLPVYNNIKIGTGASQTLLKNAGRLVLAGVYPTTGTYAQKFVEIYNAGEFSVSLTNTSLQYGSRSVATSGFNSSPLGIGGLANLTAATSLGAGQYMSIQVTSATANTTLAPDLSVLFAAGNGISGATGGKLAIVKQNATPTALNCIGSASNCGSPTPILDLLGYNSNLTSPIGDIWGEVTVVSYDQINVPFDGTTALRRKNNGCTDNNVNNTDFEFVSVVTVPARNKLSPRFICP